MDIDTPIGCDVSHVSFSFITTEDVKRLSVKALNNPITFDPITNYPSGGGLYDPVLGAFDKHESCATCKLDSFSCPGHFGHIELSVPVYHPLLFKQLYNLLRSTCFCCHSLKMKFAKSYRYMARLHLARAGLFFESIELGDTDVREMDLGDALGGEEANIASTAGLDDANIKTLIDHFCNQAFKKHDLDPKKIKYQKPSTMTHDYIRNLIKEILSVACNTKMCENCGAKSPTLRKETNSKIFMNPLSGRDKARMEAKGLLEKNVYGAHDIHEDEDIDIDEQLEDEAAKKSKSIFMTPMEVRQHMKLMWDKENAFMDHLFGSIMYGKGNKRKSTFEIFFLDVIPVAPTKFRPISKMGDKQFDHPQNTFLVEIIKSNNSIVELSRLKRDLKEKVQEGAEQLQNNRNPFVGMITSWISLQESVNNLHDSTKNPKSKLMPSGIKQIMEKKEGLFRKHMMGKRVNYAARSVISPDPMIETSEIGIPLVFAKKLTYPEPVTQYNINEMRQAVINGPGIYPGASSVQNEDGTLISLQHCSDERRLALANQLSTPMANSSSSENTPFLNKKVHRHLRNGDMLLLNRQPTLHKPSIMGHVARILPGEKTIRMHYANCNTYNADFDGDEMNVHFPQNPIAQAEARLIMNTNNQYLVPTSGEPLRGLIQDHVVTGVLMTSRDTFLTREDYTQLVFGALPPSGKRILTVSPAVMKPVPLWTGKQVISTIMKNLTDGYKPLNMESSSQTPSKSWSVKQKVNTEEGSVLILDGELLTGVLDKKQFGAKAYGLVHSCFEVYGGDIAGKLLSTLGRLFTRYTQFIGFSCRMDDLVVLPEADVVRRAKIADALQQGREILMEFAFPDPASIVETPIEKKLKATIMNPLVSAQDVARAKKTLGAIEDQRLFKTLEDTIRSDEKLAALDNKMKSKTGSVTTGIVKDTIPNGLLKPFPENGMQLMTISGAKGSNVNVTQISCMLGQQELEGRRVPVMVSGKTLPSFRAFDLGPRAGGYITGRFLTGIKPQEYYFHCMAGREGLVDTAVKTARSGYLQRCLIKHMEGLKVNYDSTVRDSADGSIYQFHYGEDSLDVTKSTYLKKFKFNAQNYEAFLDKYNPHAAVKALECQKAIKHAKKAHKKPEKYEPTLAKFNPGRHLGAVSEKFYADLQDYITKDPDSIFGENSRPSEDTFEALMQLKYISSLVEPGEAVGVLAAQSVGEPSTQMTLNTFHFAGHGAKNVTLGIPRLREIIMTASTKPKTPQMNIPFKPHVEKTRAEEICRGISKLTLDMLIEDATVTEKFVSVSHGRYRSYRLHLKFCKRAEYESEFGLKTEELQRVLEKQFIKKLVAMIQKDLMNSKKNQEAEEDQIGRGQDVARFQESQEVSNTAGEGSSVPKKISKGAKSVLSDDEGDDMELDASSANRAQKKKQHTSYDGPDDEDKEIINSLPESDAEDIPDDSTNAANVDEIVSDNRFVFDYAFDQKKGRWCEFELHFPSNTKKILMVSHIEKVASSCVITEVPGISKCFVTENKETGELVMTSDGVNITGLYALDDEFDLARLESNDIATILKYYGVEAARKTIIREVSSVFAVYGIDVDPRHLTVIADYMTFEGGYRPFNRMGIESNVSPFAKMTFETTFHFLTDATMRGDSDSLTNPSARIVVGRVVEGGTGSFEIVQPLSQDL